MKDLLRAMATRIAATVTERARRTLNIRFVAIALAASALAAEAAAQTSLRSSVKTAPAPADNYVHDKGIYAADFDYYNAQGQLVTAPYVINDFAIECAWAKGKGSFSRPVKDTLIFKCTRTLDFIEHPRTKPETVTFVHTFKDRHGRAVLESITSRNGLKMTPQGVEQVVKELGKPNE